MICKKILFKNFLHVNCLEGLFKYLIRADDRHELTSADEVINNNKPLHFVSRAFNWENIGTWDQWRAIHLNWISILCHQWKAKKMQFNFFLIVKVFLDYEYI